VHDIGLMNRRWTDLVSALLLAAPIILPIYEIGLTYIVFSSAPDSLIDKFSKEFVTVVMTLMQYLAATSF
jgi:hypothetical protein